MDREGFLETVRRQYEEQIRELYLECAHETGKVDTARLSSALSKLLKSAKAEGLSSNNFADLIQAEIPGDVRNQIQLPELKKAA